MRRAILNTNGAGGRKAKYLRHVRRRSALEEANTSYPRAANVVKVSLCQMFEEDPHQKPKRKQERVSKRTYLCEKFTWRRGKAMGKDYDFRQCGDSVTSD